MLVLALTSIFWSIVLVACCINVGFVVHQLKTIKRRRCPIIDQRLHVAKAYQKQKEVSFLSRAFCTANSTRQQNGLGLPSLVWFETNSDVLLWMHSATHHTQAVLTGERVKSRWPYMWKCHPPVWRCPQVWAVRPWPEGVCGACLGAPPPAWERGCGLASAHH